MKTLALISAILIAGGTIASSAEDLPKGVFTLSQLEEAKAAATAKKQPLVFVYTDINSTCPLCQGSTKDTFKSFHARGTLVYVNGMSNDQQQAPSLVREMRAKPEMGNIIPMVFVTTADASKEIKGYSYAVLKDGGAAKAARDLRKVLEGADVSGAAAKSDTKDSAPAAGADLLAEEQTWENAQGKTITAAVKTVTDTTVTFVFKGGKTVDYPLDKLSSATRDKLEVLKK